jgi:hypothetical protein
LHNHRKRQIANVAMAQPFRRNRPMLPATPA